MEEKQEVYIETNVVVQYLAFVSINYRNKSSYNFLIILVNNITHKKKFASIAFTTLFKNILNILESKSRSLLTGNMKFKT